MPLRINTTIVLIKINNHIAHYTFIYIRPYTYRDLSVTLNRQMRLGPLGQGVQSAPSTPHPPLLPLCGTNNKRTTNMLSVYVGM